MIFFGCCVIRIFRIFYDLYWLSPWKELIVVRQFTAHAWQSFAAYFKTYLFCVVLYLDFGWIGSTCGLPYDCHPPRNQRCYHWKSLQNILIVGRPGARNSDVFWWHVSRSEIRVKVKTVAVHAETCQFRPTDKVPVLALESVASSYGSCLLFPSKRGLTTLRNINQAHFQPILPFRRLLPADRVYRCFTDE